ncbi:MAG: alpha/beta fold hydrolase [Solirubrobacterales bacterium]|nr:alpha/beta fold hydrolase [Solirubrobacterales bacterium]
MTARTEYETYQLGDFRLVDGMTLRNAWIAYKTYGTLSEPRDNAIVYPTWYSGRHWENEWLIGDGMALDPERYFIIVPNMLGNGLSSSPSNTPPPQDRARFPNIRVLDNVRAQHRLVTEHFGIEELVAVTGWSMGAGQTYQWAVSYPEMVPRILPFCGSARTSPHNIVFLEGVKAALTADAAWKHGWYDTQPTRGLRALARVYAGWGFSQAFYLDAVYQELGYTSLEDFLVGFWEGFFLDERDANNLLTMLWTWQHGDIGLTPGFDGSLDKALGAIEAKAIVMPAEKDLYFPPEDNAYEVRHMPNAELRVIPGVWGHFAGGGANPVDTTFIDRGLKDLLA